MREYIDLVPRDCDGNGREGLSGGIGLEGYLKRQPTRRLRI